MTVQEGVLYGMGNPLLDISAEVSTSLLQKYDLQANNAILCEEKHRPLYQELVDQYDVQYIAGGATQNSLRAAQWMLPRGATVYTGCVGQDQYAERLKEAAAKDGLYTFYQVDPSNPTGTCAVLITGNSRSLVANLSAANHFKLDHLLKPENAAIIDRAKIYYISGFFLTVSPPSIQHVAEHAAAHNKIFTMNLSAPFLCQFFKEPMLAELPFADIVFGNESEAEAFAGANDLKTKDVQEIARLIAVMPKVNKKRSRLVVITQGSESTIVAEASETAPTDANAVKITVYPVNKVAPEELVDTNGAGDAFVGGFLSQLVLGKPTSECVRAGHYVAGEVIRRSGCTFPAEPSFK